MGGGASVVPHLQPYPPGVWVPRYVEVTHWVIQVPLRRDRAAAAEPPQAEGPLEVWHIPDLSNLRPRPEVVWTPRTLWPRTPSPTTP